MKAGFVGLGRMGGAMAVRLLDAGHDLIVYNRSPGKAAALGTQRVRVAQSVSEAAAAGLVLTMLSDDDALKAVGEGLVSALPPGGVHAAMGTHGVAAIAALAHAHAQAGQSLIAAPVLGRPDAAQAGRLIVIAAGPPSAVQACLPLFQTFSRSVIAAGEVPEAAAAMKIANNFMLGCAIEAMGEAFSLVEKAGGSAGTFQQIIAEGPFGCPAYRTYSELIAAGDFDKAGFTARLGLKDANLALGAGEQFSVPLPSAAIWRDRLLSAIAHGDGERDWAVMALEQRRAAGLD